MCNFIEVPFKQYLGKLCVNKYHFRNWPAFLIKKSISKKLNNKEQSQYKLTLREIERKTNGLK